MKFKFVRCPFSSKGHLMQHMKIKHIEMVKTCRNQECFYKNSCWFRHGYENENAGITTEKINDNVNRLQNIVEKLSDKVAKFENTRVSARLTPCLTLHDSKLRHITLLVIPHLIVSMIGQRELNFGFIWRFIYMTYQRMSSIKSSLPSKVVFCQRSSSEKSCLPSKVILSKRLSSVKVVFC